MPGNPKTAPFVDGHPARLHGLFMGRLQPMRRAGEHRRHERMNDSESEHDARGEQERVLLDDGNQLRPEFGLRGHASPQSIRSRLAILGKGLLGSRHDIGPGTTERLYEVDLRS